MLGFFIIFLPEVAIWGALSPRKWTDLGITGKTVPWGSISAIEVRTMGVEIMKFGDLSRQIADSSYKTRMDMDEL